MVRLSNKTIESKVIKDRNDLINIIDQLSEEEKETLSLINQRSDLGKKVLGSKWHHEKSIEVLEYCGFKKSNKEQIELHKDLDALLLPYDRTRKLKKEMNIMDDSVTSPRRKI